MRWKIALVAVILAVGLYLILSHGLTGDEPELTAGKMPEEILTETKKKGAALDSFKYCSTVTAGEQLTVNLRGTASPAKKEELLEFSWESSQGYGESAAYIKDQRIFVYHPLKNLWFRPEEEPGLKQLVGILGNQLRLLNPYRSLERINLEKARVTNTGTEVIDEREVTVIEVFPGAKANEWFEGVLPPQLIGAKVADVKQIYWIGNKDLYIYKYILRAKIKILGLQLLDFQVRSTLRDFNKAKITIPNELRKKLLAAG